MPAVGIDAVGLHRSLKGYAAQRGGRRGLDDKARVAIPHGVARALMKSGESPAALAVLIISIYEDVSHGSSARLPHETAELNAMDMTAVGKSRSLERLVPANLLTLA